MHNRRTKPPVAGGEEAKHQGPSPASPVVRSKTEGVEPHVAGVGKHNGRGPAPRCRWCGKNERDPAPASQVVWSRTDVGKPHETGGIKGRRTEGPSPASQVVRAKRNGPSPTSKVLRITTGGANPRVAGGEASQAKAPVASGEK